MTQQPNTPAPVEKAAPMTHAEAAAAIGINSAIHRIQAGRPADALEPLRAALQALDTAQQAAQPVAPIADWEEIGTVLASVADNLGDMPISDEWAAKTAKRAWSLLERNNYFRAAQPVAGEPVAHEVPRAWRQALRKLAFMARTSGGTAGPDSGLMMALDEAEALLSQPYRHTAAPAPVGLVPLTPSEKRRMWHAATDLHRAVSHFESYCQGIEDGEAHHGIKAGKDGAA